ncbi:MAG: YlbF family regulator [Verrucomicrobiota bacterium]
MNTTTTAEGTTIEEKAQELCQWVVDSPKFVEARDKIVAFLQDQDAQLLYRAYHEKGMEISQRQHEGDGPTGADLTEFENLEEKARENPVADAFMNSEAEMNDIFTTVTKYLQRTLQTGSVPTSEDFADSECCGNSGCGCG